MKQRESSMKKISFFAFILSALVLIGTSAVAGGDTIPPDCTSIDIDNSAQAPCREGTVYIDKKEKLMWQDELYRDHEESAYKNGNSSGKAGSWSHAQRYCQDLVYADFTDWRLPTVNELMYLHEKVHILQYSLVSDFWTSTPSKGSFYWTVFTADGFSYERKSSESHYFRCVRCIQSKSDTVNVAAGRI